ncbi:DarT ssDNA thymidine ADP-ribosyltransferase family protein [Stenotrophomonas geniculata]|uniref:DarT ssDNA thymidine ADP-ribosyltransferase family protein n=1 Tax=Stenotrophomonas geniculata TaxID=86188 RepID=UPI001F1C09B7|nr:DarT ssDNA thymidine ADP-ribosyltransferase family protein [Stenotrophomonas geniculata]MCF3478264.1 DUF4433 domain-containing protein [Stenotrophomonas maltophilia]WNF10884.1 DarT ssDNA thymidine ADP-ribosyltransferase family protein [Stenotrophomonas geniculata]
MPKRFIFRQVDQRDLSVFFKDGEVRSKNYLPAQACHQTSHKQIVQRRNSQIVTLPHGGVVNDYVAFYFSPITAFTFAIHRGSVNVVSPAGVNLGLSKLSQRAFLVADLDTIFLKYQSVCFSDYALNTNVPMPTVICDRLKLDSHVNWAHFDEQPIAAQIPEIGYNGVCRYFRSESPGHRTHRSTERMAEFLVKDAVSISDFCAIILPEPGMRQKVLTMAANSAFEGVVLDKPGCFIS